MTKELILQKAFQLTKNDGIENLSMRKLAVEAGCTPSTIYHYFHDKNEVLNELVLYVEREHRSKKYYDNMAFADLIAAFFEMDEESENYHRFISKYCRASFLSDETKKELVKNHEELRNLWEGFRKNGELRTDLNRKTIFSILIGTVRQVAATEDIDEETRQQIIDVLIKGLSPK